jgi:hypothetical protein
MGWLFVTIAGLLICLNVAGSLMVMRNLDLSASQRAIQLLVIWLVPVIGSIICMSFASSQSNKQDLALDRTAFTDNVDAGDGRPSGVPGICGCSSGDSADDGSGD